MIRGSCLCGGVAFEVGRFVGPFELCHCSRCRKLTGSAFAAMVGVARDDFRWLAGRELVDGYDAPLLHHPPAYRASFCRRCGSPVPDPGGDGDWLEVAAGLLEGDPELRPERHIFADGKAAWWDIADPLPQLDREALLALRRGRRGGGDADGND